MSAAGDVLDRLFRKYLNRFYAIIAIKKRVCHSIAIAATYRTPRKLFFKPYRLSAVRARIRKIHRLWVLRLWSLSSNDLWLLQRGLDPSPAELEQNKLQRSFKRLASCLSRNVVYSKRKLRDKKKRVCNKSNVCPHCWANGVAAHVYVVRKVINDQLLTHKTKQLNVSLVVLERSIPSRVGGVNFAAPETLRQEILFLRHTLLHCQQLKKRVRDRARKYPASAVVGLIWRLVLIPKCDHWLLQFRVLCVHRLSQKRAYKLLVGRLPADTHCARESYVEFPANLSWSERKSNATGPDVDNYVQLLEFGRYPVELLTEDIEMTSAVINASTAVRMLGGMRAFRRVSTALIRERATIQRAGDMKRGWRACEK